MRNDIFTKFSQENLDDKLLLVSQKVISVVVQIRIKKKNLLPKIYYENIMNITLLDIV